VHDTQQATPWWWHICALYDSCSCSFFLLACNTYTGMMMHVLSLYHARAGMPWGPSVHIVHILHILSLR
jgi:hypothetical protein